jgi:hypothetical protein
MDLAKSIWALALGSIGWDTFLGKDSGARAEEQWGLSRKQAEAKRQGWDSEKV